MLLRAKEIETIVLFGIATSGVVLSTLLQASDADYRIVVIADCCADQDEELHKALLTRLFPKQAEVIAAGDFVKAGQSGSLDSSDLDALTCFVKNARSQSEDSSSMFARFDGHCVRKLRGLTSMGIAARLILLAARASRIYGAGIELFGGGLSSRCRRGQQQPTSGH